MRRTATALLLALSVAAAGVAGAQSFSTLEERMSAADFRRAGLDKLSDEELAALNDWLQKQGVSPAAAPSESRIGFNDGGFFQTSPDGDRIVATIDGVFRGWNGAGDLITLSNGQVWRVTDSASRLSVNLTNPRVTLEQNGMGGWQLRVDGYNARARVIRER